MNNEKLNLHIWKFISTYLTLQHKKEFEKMSRQHDEAWKIELEFQLLCMLDFKRVITDIEKHHQNNDSCKSKYSNWKWYHIWIIAVFTNFVPKENQISQKEHKLFHEEN